MRRRMNELLIKKYVNNLLNDEKSEATIEKYMRDLRKFQSYIGKNRDVTKESVIKYKKYLIEHYAPSSANSMLVSLNRFFKENGWHECVVKTIRIQEETFRSEKKELSKQEYYRLLDAAEKKKNKRLYYLMQTLCSTGIRISELQFITVEAICKRQAKVTLKGKIRMVILPKTLCKELKKYAKQKNIKSGPVFVTRSGKPVDRNNVSHEMKQLSKLSGVSKEKIFPHNLRHLFACVFYQMEKDLTRLADLLGHSNINTTRIYTKVSKELQIKHVEMLKLCVIKNTP